MHIDIYKYADVYTFCVCVCVCGLGCSVGRKMAREDESHLPAAHRKESGFLSIDLSPL